MIACLLSWLAGVAPYTILVITGEQGSGKSDTAKSIRGLVDLSRVPLRSPPQNTRDLIVAARSSGLVALDNLSHLPGWLSDGLCCLATGGGFSSRSLYTDSDEHVIQAQAPVILTAIWDVVTASDLVDRAVVLELPRITEASRCEAQTLQAAYAAAAPGIFAACLEAIAMALDELPRVELDRLPRMADFARWGVALERALGWPDGSFLEAYRRRRAAPPRARRRSSGTRWCCRARAHGASQRRTFGPSRSRHVRN